MTRKLPFFSFNLKNGIFRVGAFVVVFDPTAKSLPIFVIVAIAGIGHIGFNRNFGPSATIRVRGGTDTVGRWLKFDKSGRTTLLLPIDK